MKRNGSDKGISVAAIWLALAAIGWGKTLVPYAIPMTSPTAVVAAAAAPITIESPRLAVRDGHFAMGDKRIRIWGVNLSGGASFPTRAEAEQIAARLAAHGVNGVRFHDLDRSVFPEGIRDPKAPLKLSAEALDRLDCFIDQFARAGIYVTLNLRGGFEASKALKLPDSGITADSIVDLFVPQLIDIRRAYARNLLCRTNTYRHARYADDPAVAFIEIAGEDSFFMEGALERLKALPDFYDRLFATRYATWLKARYGNTAGLRKAWGHDAEPVGANLLAWPSLVDAKEPQAFGWHLEFHKKNSARLVTPKSDSGAIRIEIAQADGVIWHCQVRQPPVTLKGGRRYLLTFRARADRLRDIAYAVQQDHEPWINMGLWNTVRLTPAWRIMHASFTAIADEPAARLSFSVGADKAAVELADVVLAPGGPEGLYPEESLEAANIALHIPGEVQARAIDRVRFLMDVEKDFYDGMYAFLKKELKVKGLVAGAAAQGPCAFYIQSGMDYIGNRAYWQYPQHQAEPGDPGKWTVERKAMVDNPQDAILPKLAAGRLKGKPFTIGEYNHPAPNDFQAECVPFIATFAAAQDWDGVWLFAYSQRAYSGERRHFDSFFDIEANPAKWGFMHAGAAIFRHGGMAPHRRGYFVSLCVTNDVPTVIAQMHLKHDRDMLAAVSERMEITWKDLLSKRLEVGLTGRNEFVADKDAVGTPGQMVWKGGLHANGAFAAIGPGAKVLIGHPSPAFRLRCDGLALAAPSFAVVTVTTIDGQAFDRSQGLLITACGGCENTKMDYTDDRRSVGNNWGRPPSLIEPVEGFVTLPPGKWRACVLTPDGEPDAEVPLLQDVSGQSVLPLSPAHKTMRYLVRP